MGTISRAHNCAQKGYACFAEKRVCLSDSSSIKKLKETIFSKNVAGTPDMTPLAKAVQDLEDAYLRAALEWIHFNQKQTAAVLRMSYHQFRRLYRKRNPGFCSLLISAVF